MKLSHQRIGAILEHLGDHHVYDYCADYGEPGYSHDGDETPLVVLGDWWCRCGAEGLRDLHSIEDHHPRVFAQMTAQGVMFEWHDEWWIDHETSKAWRTTGNSYSWQPSIVCGEYDYITPDHDIEEWLLWAIDNPTRCIPTRVWGSADIEAQGFEQYNGQFESGWYPGQNDDPREITRTIREEHGNDVEIVFMLDATRQFDIRFSAWIRQDPTRDEET